MSGVFTLDKKGADRVEEQAGLNLLDVSQQAPLFWDDAAEATGKGVVQGIGVGYMMLGTTGALIEDKVAGTGTDARDAHFRRLDTFIDDWTPDPHTTGTAGQVGNGLAKILPPLLLARGNPAATAFGTTAVTVADTGLPLVKQGVDANTAGAVAAVQGMTNLVGLKVPTFGVTRLQRVATGAVGNVAVETPAGLASADILDGAGYDAQAEQFAPTTESTAIAGLVGAAFGLPGGNGPRLSPSERAAVATLNNADHFTERSMPGVPKTHEAAIAHQDDLGAAINAVLNDEPVKLPRDNLDQFLLRPELRPAANDATTPAADGYDAMLVALESGGRADAKAASSSATGLHQFTDGTWLNTVRTAKPAWAAGVDDAQLLAMRTDPAKSREMELALRAENAAALTSAGQEASPFNLYAAHHFGSGKGVAFAKAGPDMPMTAILTKGQINANPYLKGLTKAEAIANWTARARKAGVEMDDAPRVAEAADAADGAAEVSADDIEGMLSRGEISAQTATWLREAMDDGQAGKQDFGTAAGAVPESGWLDHTIARADDGQPVTLYRGSRDGTTDAGAFEQLGASTGHPSAHLGVFLTSERGDAARYGQVGEYHLDLRNPKQYDIADLPPLDDADEARALRQQLEAEGHDGIVLDASAYGGPVQYVVFKPHQVVTPSTKKAAAKGGKPEAPAKEAPIAAFRREAEAVASALPAAGPDTVRLWRGNRPGEVGTATTFTSDLPGIALPFRKAYGGELSYIDVPAKDLASYENTAATARGAEFNLPADMAARAQVARPKGAESPSLAARAAADTVAAYPDLVVMGEDGIARPASEVLAEADAQQAQAEETVRAIEAAASCFMRTAA